MKAIRFMEPDVIEYSGVATPEPKDNEVLAQICLLYTSPSPRDCS